jgi:hypothetical protein
MKNITINIDSGVVYLTNLHNSLILGFETQNKENIGMFI